MRSFNVRILANNEAGTWTSWGEKIAAIKAFYAPVCELDITLAPSKLTPQFAPYAPISGSADTYVVDPTWYQENVLPLAEGADMIIFVVPPTDHPNIITYMGLDVYQQGQPGRLTVFSDETSHTYVGTVDQGETAVIYAEHEISHQFYALLAKTDNTHLYFYAGTPEKVLADFDFDEQELDWLTQLKSDLEQMVGLIEARQPISEVPPSIIKIATQPQNPAPTAAQTVNAAQPSFPPKILAWAQIIGTEEGANPSLDNPGDLKLSDLTKSWGAIQGFAAADGGFMAKFPTMQLGEVALCDFLVLGCQDQLLAFHSPAARTLAGFMTIFAGNPPADYITAIVQAMGGDPNVQVSTFLA
jgi:hypothetical protein